VAGERAMQARTPGSCLDRAPICNSSSQLYFQQRACFSHLRAQLVPNLRRRYFLSELQVLDGASAPKLHFHETVVLHKDNRTQLPVKKLTQETG
jgi:hypothetical protein